MSTTANELRKLSLEQLGCKWARDAVVGDAAGVDDAITELRRRDEDCRRLVEAARRAERFCGPGSCSDPATEVHDELRAALAPFQETDNAR